MEPIAYWIFGFVILMFVGIVWGEEVEQRKKIKEMRAFAKEYVDIKTARGLRPGEIWTCAVLATADKSPFSLKYIFLNAVREEIGRLTER